VQQVQPRFCTEPRIRNAAEIARSRDRTAQVPDVMGKHKTGARYDEYLPRCLARQACSCWCILLCWWLHASNLGPDVISPQCHCCLFPGTNSCSFDTPPHEPSQADYLQ